MQRARKEIGGKRREREWEKEEDACEYVNVCVCWRARAHACVLVWFGAQGTRLPA